MATFYDKYYHQRLIYQREKNSFHAEFCLASISLSKLNEHVTSILHPDELTYYKSLTFEKRKHDYLLGKFVAKKAVTFYESEIPLSEIYIDSGIFEFPIVYYPGKEKIQVSLSHSEKTSVAISYSEAHPMGIDLELIDLSKMDVIETQLSDNEKKFFLII